MEPKERVQVDPILQQAIVEVVGTRVFWLILDKAEILNEAFEKRNEKTYMPSKFLEWK